MRTVPIKPSRSSRLPAGQRGQIGPRIPGLIAFAVGVGLLTGPRWSSTLPRNDAALVIVLGAIFAGIGTYTTIPDAWPRARTLAFAVFMGAFGLACAALALAHTLPDGTTVIAGLGKVSASEPMPMWAKLVAGFFALLCLAVSALGFWGLVRGLIRGADAPSGSG